MIDADARKPLLHEVIFGFFLAAIWARFSIVLGPLSEPALTYLAAIVVSLAVFFLTRWTAKVWAWRVRLGWYAIAMSLLFQHMRGRFPLIAGPSLDDALLAIDRHLFGRTPAEYLQAIETPALTEMLSFCYGLFFFYLYGSILYRLFGPLPLAKRFFAGLFTIYGIGFTGYSLVPALGPYLGEPQLFAQAIDGGFVYGLVAEIVKAGTNGVDVFPSLHTAVTVYILVFSAIWSRRLFWLALGPAIGLVIATVYLRFHYGIDVLAGLALAFAAHLALRHLYPQQQLVPMKEGVSPA
jgi:membrane-associated phospholipid phosphatase